MRTARAPLALRWLPALAGAAYVATVCVLWHELVTNNNWDTDVTGKMVVAERLRGSGPVYIPHYGEWVMFWWMLATRWLPSHRDLWSVTGYALALVSAGVLVWATWRVAGRWAGVTAGAIALVVGPFVLRSFLSTTGAHTTNPFGAVVLAAVLVLLTRTRSWAPAIAGGVIAGTCAASDGLLWAAGIVPFAVAAALLVRSTRRRDIGTRAAGLLVITVATALATNAIMHALDFRVEGLTVALSAVRDLPHNVVHLGRMIALLGGANYALPGGYPAEPVRAAVALMTFAAVAAPLVATVRVWAAEPLVRAYAVFWAAAAVLLCLVFVGTPNAAALGSKSVNYLLTLAPAAGVGVALLGRSLRAQVTIAVCVAFVAAVNIAGITDGRAEVTGIVALPKYAPQIVRVLEHAHATRGYAGFWDAQNLSWQTDMKLLVAPVNNCGDELCPNNFFTIESWYAPRGGPTFLLVDATLPLIHAPPFAKTAADTHRFGPLTLYIFDNDIAAHIRGSAAS
jgi:hypothetical protein